MQRALALALVGHRRILATVALAAFLACAPDAAHATALLEEGQAFPAWSMPDQTGKTVSSSDLAGKTYLLWFYPKAMTPGCTAEGNALRDSFPELQARGVEVLGVSFDAPAENAKFAAAQSFPFRLLTDDGTLAVQVGAADSSDQATARRISYLVGPDGKVLRAYGSVNPATHAEDVLRDVSATATTTK
ncbi:MAG TPA: peroxiredoxin [Candidatus Binatia bacterium]